MKKVLCTLLMAAFISPLWAAETEAAPEQKLMPAIAADKKSINLSFAHRVTSVGKSVYLVPEVKHANFSITVSISQYLSVSNIFNCLTLYYCLSLVFASKYAKRSNISQPRFHGSCFISTPADNASIAFFILSGVAGKV